MSTFQVVENTNKQEDKRTLIVYCLERATLLFSIKMALIVGTILALINHGQAMFTGHVTFDQLIPILITYCVPFTVSMYGQVNGKRERDRLYAEAIAANKQSETTATRSE
ncbi:MAG TPA: nitrate/nitrite transporter NrtS [Ktedonobacteraceae bacterium]